MAAARNGRRQPGHLVLRWAIITLAGVAGLVALLFALIQTPPGKSMLAQLAGRLASGDGLTVRIEELHGLVPWTLRAGRIVLSDPQGQFAQASDVSLDWHPLEVINGVLSVEALQVASIDFQRKPDLPPAKLTDAGSGGLPHMIVNRIAVERLSLGAAVLGHSAELSLHATVDSAPGLMRFTIDAQRHDAPGSIKGSASFAPDGKTLDVDVVADEPAGGLLSRLLNIDGAPDFHAALQGHGSLDLWNGTLSLRAGQAVRIDGKATIRAVDAGHHRAGLSLTGDIAKALPAKIAPLFEGTTQLSGTVLVDDQAQIAIESFTAGSAGFGLQLGGGFDARAFVMELNFVLKAREPRRYAALLPAGMKLGPFAMNGTIRGTPKLPSIDARIQAGDLALRGYRMASLDAQLKTAPDARQGLIVSLDGQASGLAADDTAATAALGEHVHVTAQGVFSAKRQIALNSFSLDGPAAQLRFDGHADAQTVSGKLKVARLDLGVAGPLAGQRLGGQLALDADINSAVDFSRFAIALNGHLDNFSSAMPVLNGLLVPSLKLAGTLKRDANGAIVASNMTASSAMLQATLDGRLDQAVANLKAHVTLADIGKLDGRLSGRAEIDASFSGSLDRLGLQAALAIKQGKAMGRDIEGLSLTIKSSDITGKVAGDIALDGWIGGKPATGSARLTTADDGTRQLQDLVLSVGSVNAKGALRQAPDGKFAGDITLKAGNLDDLAPLTLTALGGQLDASIKFDTDKDVQRIAVDATANGLRASGSTVGSARIKLTVLDPLGTPRIDGTADLANVTSGSLVIDKVTFAASNAQGGMALKLNATSLGASVYATAMLSALGNASMLNLTALKIVKDGATATLAKPASITIDGGTTRIDGLVLNANGGSVSVAGTAGNALNLNVELRSLPLSLLAVVAPDFDASGTVSGKLAITGTAAAPGGQYDLAVASASTRALARAGLGPFNAKVRGSVANSRIGIDATISAPSLQGIRVAGSVPLGQGEIDLTVKGEAGLNLVNTALATTGAYAAGKLTIDASIKGTADAPQAGGTIRIVNGSFNDAINGMAFDKINGEFVAQGREVAIRSLTAHTANGGSVQAQGTVTLDPAAGFPGNVQITMDKARLLSNETVRLVADAKLALSGPLGIGPKLSGRVDVRSLDINIPDQLPGSLQATDVRHINVPQSQQAAIQTPQTKAKALRKAQAKAGPRTAPMVITLDLTIAAPARVFVRGRGIDAELAGTLRLTGTTDNPVTNGGFDLRRGRLNIGQRQLNFSRGKLTFRGSTDPELDLSADSQSADVTATVHVTGRASAPQITFASTPSLPQDEVLARLLFGKPAGALTPGQAIQVARTIVQFSGGGASPLDDVRRSLGITSLDIGTGENGSGGQAGVGKRLNDNVYLGVSQGTATGSSQVTVDVDVLKNIKVTGKAGAAGGEVGIGAEWDY